MEIEIALDRGQFLTTEDIPLTVRIRNTSASPVEVPDPTSYTNTQPVYRITGPAFPQPVSLSLAREGGGETVTVPLGAGKTLEEKVPLSRVASFSKPGAYTVSASLEWSGQKAKSGEARFTVVEGGFRFLQVGAKAHGQEPFPVPVIAAGAGGIYFAGFDEERPDLGEIRLNGLSRIADFDAAATDFAAAVAAESGLAAPRHAWLIGRKLAVAGWKRAVEQLDLSFDAALVKPALMSPDGDLAVLLLDRAGARLSMARFPYAPGQAATLVWTNALPSPVTASRATLSPDGKRFAAFVSVQGGSTMVTMAEIDNRGARLRSAAVEGLAPMPDAPPAIYAGPAGAVRVACLMVAAGEPRAMSAVELRWAAGGEADVRKGEAVALPAEPQAGAAAYSVAGNGEPKRVWMVLLKDGRSLSSVTPDAPWTPQGKVVMPFQVLQMSECGYYLALDAEGRPQLQLLR